MFAEILRFKYIHVNRTNNTTGKRRLTSSNRAAMLALHAKNDTTNLFSCKLGELKKKNQALLFFSGKETIQLLTVQFKPLRCCLRIVMFENSAKI